MNTLAISKIIFDTIKEAVFGIDEVNVFHGDSNEIAGGHIGTEIIIYPLNSPKIGTGGERVINGKKVSSQIWEQKFQITVFNRNSRITAQDIALRVVQWFGLKSTIKKNNSKDASFKRIESLNSVRFDDDNDSHNVAFIFELSAIFETIIEFDIDSIVELNKILIQGV
jgi:hypothetical protein